MNLLFTIKALDSGGGGAERVLTQVTGELVERGHNAEIVTFDRPEAPTFYQLHPRVQWHRLSVGDARSRTGLGDLFRRALALRSYIRGCKPDVAVGFLHSSYVPLSLGLWGSGTPVIASEHISFDHYQNRPAERASIRATAALCSKMTAVTERVRAGFPEAVRRKMVAMPNPVPLAAKSKRGREASDQKILLSVGRLEQQKDHRTLVAAFAGLAGRFPEWTLRIVGDGSLRRELQAQVRSLGLEGRVQLRGADPNVAPEYARADLFAIPSRYESFGLVTAEALSYGIPTIGFLDCPGTNELIDDGVNGLLVFGADRVAALEEGLLRLMSSADLRAKLGRAGPASIERYSIGSVVDRWEALIKSVAQVTRR